IRNRALVRLQYVDSLDRVPQSAFLLEVEPITLLITLNEHTEEAKKKLQVLFSLRQRERVDGEIPCLLADIEVRALENRRKRLEASSDIKDESQRLVLLCVLQQKNAEIALATARHAENQGMGNVASMQVEEVGRAVVGFDDCQVLRAEVRVGLFAWKDRKQERQVGVVRVQQVQLAEVHRIVARHGGEIGVQLVVGFCKQIAVRVGEDASKLGHKLIEVRS